jgi:hypothetical protein
MLIQAASAHEPTVSINGVRQRDATVVALYTQVGGLVELEVPPGARPNTSHTHDQQARGSYVLEEGGGEGTQRSQHRHEGQGTKVPHPQHMT